MSLSLEKLPMEMIYRIMDRLPDKDLALSVNNVCQRLNLILNSYQRYKVHKRQFHMTSLNVLMIFLVVNCTASVEQKYK